MIKCKLTGFKGEFDAIAKDKRICSIHNREVYTVESLCKTVSINVFGNTVNQRVRNFENGRWPVEFYYS